MTTNKFLVGFGSIEDKDGLIDLLVDISDTQGFEFELEEEGDSLNIYYIGENLSQAIDHLGGISEGELALFDVGSINIINIQ